MASISKINVGGTDYTLTPASHTHGNIQNGGTLQTSDITIANGDKLVVTDSSDSSKVARASISFDGSTTTQFLSKKGTWQSVSSGTSVYDGTTTSDTKYDALFLETLASGVDTVKVGLDMDLLWTNSAPTSSFSAQTIQLDLSGYALILITSENSVSFAENNVGSKRQITYSSTSGQIRHRDFTVVTTGITFDAGYGGSSTDNSNCRPYKIYGIR